MAHVYKVPVIGLLWARRLKVIAERHLTRDRVDIYPYTVDETTKELHEQHCVVELPCGEAKALEIIKEFTETTAYMTS